MLATIISPIQLEGKPPGFYDSAASRCNQMLRYIFYLHVRPYTSHMTHIFYILHMAVLLRIRCQPPGISDLFSASVSDSAPHKATLQMSRPSTYTF